MRRWLISALLALLALPALAADNGIVITPCGTGCVTTRSKDVGLGVQSGVGILGDTAGNPIYGTAGAANANVLTVQGIASMTPLLVNGSGVTQPVSGTVTANQGGAPWSVSQSGTWTVQQGTPPWTVLVNDRTATGTVTAVNQTVAVSTAGDGNATALVSADTNVTLVFEGTVEGSTWFSINAYPVGGGASVTSTTSTGQWAIPAGGFNQVRLRVSAVGATPTATIFLNSGAGSTQPNVVVSPTAANFNANVSGTVTANAGSGTFTVGGTVTANAGTGNFNENLAQVNGSTVSTAATGVQKVGVTGNTGAAMDAAGQNAASPANELLTGCQFNTSPTAITSGNISPVQCNSSGSVKVDGSAVTQPVSGTVTANQGGAPWQENVTQFNGTASTAKASGTNAATTDTALVVAPSPNPSTVCTSVKPINQTASTDLITSTNKLHICSIVLISATAQNLSLVEGTGSVCATGIAALIGGTTASLAVAANGGFSAVSERAWLLTQTTADHLCLLQSGAGNVSGTITYTDHN